MPSRPISLIGLQCVLEHMEVNKRFQVAQHCPALRRAEKRTPLKIDFLLLHDFDIAINDTKYCLEIIQNCPHDAFMETFAMLKKIQFDLDQHCLPDPSADKELTPGDLVFKTEFNRLETINPKNKMELRKNDLEASKKDLQSLMRPDNSRRLHPTFNSNTIPDLQAKIKEIEENLEDFHLGREVVRHPCKLNLQFSIIGEKENRVQLGLYNMKIGKAMKQLTEFLFGCRRHPISVKKLEIQYWGNPFFGRTALRILRLPEDMKLQIKELQVDNQPDKVCSVLRPILGSDSFKITINQ